MVDWKALSAAFLPKISAETFLTLEQSNFGISGESAVSAFGTNNLFFEATLYKGVDLKGGGQ